MLDWLGSSVLLPEFVSSSGPDAGCPPQLVVKQPFAGPRNYCFGNDHASIPFVPKVDAQVFAREDVGKLPIIGMLQRGIDDAYPGALPDNVCNRHCIVSAQ